MLTCILVPHYDHVTQFRALLPQLHAQGLPLIVVDDASPDNAYAALQQLLDEQANGATLIRHAGNLGKGAAVSTGLRHAIDAGCTHALQIDADGQHDAADIARFLDAGRQYPQRIICGEPVFDDSISRLRYYARYITLSFSWLETMSREIRDAMCGYRLYPLEPVVTLLDKINPGRRMSFDPEILVRGIWAGIGLHFIPVRVRYPESGRSHFRYIRDNIEIAWMHTRLLLGMIVRLPVLLRRRLPARQEPGA